MQAGTGGRHGHHAVRDDLLDDVGDHGGQGVPAVQRDPVGAVETRSITGKQVGVLLLYACTFAMLVTGTVLYGNAIGPWVVPLIVLGMLSWGYFAGVAVYEVFVEGAKDGFSVATKIIPYLVAILGAVGMLRGAGAIDVFADLVGGFTARVGMPAEALPMALLRPLSGSGAYGVMTDILVRRDPTATQACW